MKDAKGHGSDPRGAHSAGVQKIGKNQVVTAFKMWPIGEQSLDAAHNIVRNAWLKFPGHKSAEVVHEARSFVHSQPTHTGVRMTGIGPKFAKAARAAGFRI